MLFRKVSLNVKCRERVTFILVNAKAYYLSNDKVSVSYTNTLKYFLLLGRREVKTLSREATGKS